jgi:putative hydrolase of the HAD superfamily
VGRAGLLIDWGGVLTSSVFEAFAAFCEAEGLDPQTLRRAFRADASARRLLEDLECGRLQDAEFERLLAARLEIDPGGLIERLFAGLRPEPEMLAGVAAARRAGVRTGLLSNSWGEGRYDRARFPELFDVTVVSGEIGMRKPDPAIYALAAERLGLPPRDIVFVDDLPHNLEPAEAIGMATVLHRGNAGQTLGELEAYLGVKLQTTSGRMSA